MGIVPFILVACGAMVKPCSSVAVHDHGLLISHVQSKICGAHQHGGWMNMSRQSADTEDPFYEVKVLLQTICFKMFDFGVSLVPSEKDTALKTADADTGKLAVLTEKVKACCADNSNFFGAVTCTAQLAEYGAIASEYTMAVANYFKAYATETSGMKDAICKLMDVQTDTKPIRDVASTVVSLNNQMADTCVSLPPGTMQIMNSMTTGITSMPQIVADGLSMAQEALHNMICSRG
mmetsp:Transcript_88608/g.251176  ORF Transcript_88608/g.251176 Transcript_88608/m.251176 type:complete len:235 (-) Transcript_88608:100-804(-)